VACHVLRSDSRLRGSLGSGSILLSTRSRKRKTNLARLLRVDNIQVKRAGTGQIIFLRVLLLLRLGVNIVVIIYEELVLYNRLKATVKFVYPT
jgi:hypothetical protein